MPTASDWQRALMEKWFGDPIDDSGPLDLLFSHGFVDDRGILRPPVPSHTVNIVEWECIAFLINEWDYGFEPADG